MKKVRKFINKLSKIQKIIFLISVFGFIFLLSISIPTFSRYKNRNISSTAVAWDGSVATSYKKGDGSEENPYIISNGSELAYFCSQLSTTDYQNEYFELSNDIVLNEGVFSYDETNGIQYIINDQTYYVGEYSSNYYDNIERTGTEIGTLNIFNSLDNFKGIFDGKSYRIYGLYITNESSNELGLFTNLQGTVKDLYVENAIVYGGTTTGGIASSTDNATITDVLYDGYVIGKNTDLTQNINTNPTLPSINLQTTETTNYIDLTDDIPFIGGEIVSTSITGDYTVNGVDESLATIKINGITVTGGSFTIDLGSNILDSVAVTASVNSEEGAILTLSNLSYNITYNYGVSGGISAISNNTFFKNSVNKGDIYGYSASGGLIGVTTNLMNINQSYNTGNISSDYVSSGLIGVIEKSDNDITISKSYNTGILTAPNIGGLVGIISNNTGLVSISNSFEAIDTNYCIGTITDTTVNINNSYYTSSTAISSGTVTGNFISTTLENLETKDYLINNLSYNEFIDFNDLSSNTQDAWVYEDEELPILFIDDIKNPIANIYAGTYSWNNLSYEISSIRFTSNITFSIEAADELRPIKETYYYISNSDIPLTSSEISQIDSWISYTDIVQITEEGNYVIYVKVVDYNDNVTYLDTDLLVLDLPGSSATISFDNNSWSDLRSDLNYIYEGSEKSATIDASDNISEISSIKYYITDQILSSDDLDNLDSSNWIDYSDSILINQIGKNIIYVKLTDSYDYVNYINSDIIVFNGYTNDDLIIGRNSSSYQDTGYISSKSTITLDFSYSNLDDDLEGYTHNLMSNILLPLGTNITLIDNINDKVYSYQINTSDDIYGYADSCDIEDTDCQKVANYPFTLFSETGSINKYFEESSYYQDGTVSENFTVVIDFSNTNILSEIDNVSLYLELHNLSDLNVRPTLYDTIKSFNIISDNADALLYLNTDYSGDDIIYNSNSSTNININSGLNYKYIDDTKINDTTYEDKNIGIAIKFVDSEGNTIDKDYLKNIIFKIGDDEYYPEEDNIVHINLGSTISDLSKVLTINTNENNSNLSTGTYYLKIYNYISNDGYYYDELSSTEISIPVVVSNNNIEYGFNVLMDDANRIVDKNNATMTIPFNILENGSLNNPNIRVSLYKKDQLTAYNQDYSIVDLASFVSDTLNEYDTDIYYASTDPIKYNGKASTYNYFELNLLTSNFENTGYKFVFELYDGNKKIGTIEKHFIVK